MLKKGIIDQGSLTDEEYEKMLTNDKLIFHGHNLEDIDIKDFAHWYETNYSKREHDNDSLYKCIESFLYWYENIDIINFGG